MKNQKHCIFNSILAILIFVLTLACSDSNRLSGTYEINDARFRNATIAFNGNNFLITQFPAKNRITHYDGITEESWGLILPFVERINMNALVLLRQENHGNNQAFYYRDETKGTYSISDDKIELLFENGDVKVLNFSRTENTITIDRFLFTRS